MRISLDNVIVELDNDESYIVSKSINELGGPYHSRFSKHLREFHKDKYERLWNEINRTDKLLIVDIPFVLETLYLLIHEMSDWDFGALYDDITKDDVKKLYKKLEKVFKEEKNKNVKQNEDAK